jgi:hypothetical protein
MRQAFHIKLFYKSTQLEDILSLLAYALTFYALLFV